MFEHFTFGAQAQIQDDEVAASPTDTSFPSPISPQSFPFQREESSGSTSINDIVHKLTNSSLKTDESSQQSIWKNQLPNPEFNIDPFYEKELSFVSTTRGMATVHYSNLLQTPLPPPSKNGTVACRRMQRQLNVQLQSCSHHVRDINALVEDMIVHNSQCTLRKSGSKPFLSSPPPSSGGRDELEIDMDFDGPDLTVDEDEGFSEDPVILMKEELSLRRASTPSGIRKHNGIRHKASVESAGGNGPVMINGRVKVRCVPRMRKRQVKPVPE